MRSANERGEIDLSGEAHDQLAIDPVKNAACATQVEMVRNNPDCARIQRYMKHGACTVARDDSGEILQVVGALDGRSKEAAKWGHDRSERAEAEPVQLMRKGEC